jgi:hypothetical protein
MSSVLIGRIIKRVENRFGGFYVVLAEGTASRRFRADACLFPGKIPSDSIVTFLAESVPRRAKQMPRVTRILSAPEPETVETENKQQ